MITRISILGSTGSIGRQTLDVIARHPDRYRVVALCARGNADLLFEQVRAFHPSRAGLVIEPASIPDDLKSIDWSFGPGCMIDCAREPTADRVSVAVVGVAGLEATLAALDAGKDVMLANKESLVAGGALVTGKARALGRRIIPVDSEHSAIFQCLNAAAQPPDRLVLTASGGPFREWNTADIAQATRAQALNHPNWSMGEKITVDSASMMNKALEVMEARWLFDMPPDRIDVVVHPQSIVHSMVSFRDGAVLAQMGAPDMRVPIAYALSYPERIETGAPPLDFSRLASLTFAPPDMEKFPALRLGYDALRAGGSAPVTLNAANEAAVEAFLHDRIPFGGITPVVRDTLEAIPTCAVDSLDDVLAFDRLARAKAAKLIGQNKFFKIKGIFTPVREYIIS